MFTFGIFTTHLPYVAFVFFYAYFLIFGVEKASEGRIQISEKSVTVELHLNSFDQDFFPVSTSFYYANDEYFQGKFVQTSGLKQKWKIHPNPQQKPKTFVCSSLFCRPPPTLA